MRLTDMRVPSFAGAGRHRGRDGWSRKAGEWLVIAIVLVMVMLFATSARAAASSQREFATPELAVEALMQAVQAQDAAALAAVLGPAREWLFSGDKVRDRSNARRFADVYRTKHRIATEGDKATLLLGEDDYPFAFPLVRNGTQWRFDTEAGKEQMLARRIGENELSAIEVLRAVVDAQREYASADRNGDGVVEYARKFTSTPGKRDGLYWKAKAGEPESPLGPLVAQATSEGYGQAKDAPKAGPRPYHGYVFRMLDGQGKPGAPDAVDYVVRGRKIGGFAVIAYPAKYGNTGIMTFAVTHDGVVHETDLGPQTAALGAKMKRLELGSGWTKVTTK